MLITALTKLTLLDFPGRLACIIFTGGCNLRCGYCHNAEFVLPERMAALGKGLPFETVKKFLESRKGMLDGVVICGGEPTLQLDLMEKLREIKEMGFAVKLDTNGSNPLALKRIIEAGLVDFVAMDVKDALPYRKELVGVTIGEEAIRESIRLIKESGLDYEFRTTVWPEFHGLEVMRKIGEEIDGAKNWYLQKGRRGKTLAEKFGQSAEYSEYELKSLVEELEGYADRMELRI
jgi:pyruvate formate lyase activating enzyme